MPSVVHALERWRTSADARACPEAMPLNVLRPEVQCTLKLYGSPEDSDYLFCEQSGARPGCLAYSFGVNNQIAFEEFKIWN